MKKRKYLQRISLLLGCLFIFNLAYPATADAADALRTVLAEIRAEQDAADKLRSWIRCLWKIRIQGMIVRKENILVQKLIQRLKSQNIETLIALTASNDEAQRFYKSIPNSEMRDTGIWIDIQ